MRTSYTCIIISLMLYGCQTKASLTEVKDSAQHHSDTLVGNMNIILPESSEPEEPEIPETPIDSSLLGKPNFSIAVTAFSDNKTENKAIDKLRSLISKYEQKGYVTIEVYYIHDDPVVTGRITENEIWYYDADRKLGAHTARYKSERNTTESIYLFDGESMTGAFMSSSFYDEGASYETSMVQVKSMCPVCGVTLANDDGAGYVVTQMDETAANKNTDNVLRSHADRLIEYKDMSTLTRVDNRYVSIVLPNPDDLSDSIKYSIDPSLISHYFKNAVTQD